MLSDTPPTRNALPLDRRLALGRRALRRPGNAANTSTRQAFSVDHELRATLHDALGMDVCCASSPRATVRVNDLQVALHEGVPVRRQNHEHVAMGEHVRITAFSTGPCWSYTSLKRSRRRLDPAYG